MIVTTADWHGEWNKVIREIKRLELSDCTIIQVGDFGIGFEKPEKELRTMQYLNATLESNNIKLYAIRGNHDDPAYFDGTYKVGNIELLADYTILNIEGKSILCVGGAISVDRSPNPEVPNMYGKPWKGRKLGKSYWVDEAFVLCEEKLKDIRDIDVVVTHSAPAFCYPFIKSGMDKWIKYDPALKQECDNERNDHSKMHEILVRNNTIAHWFYGHYHESHHENINGTEFRLLGLNDNNIPEFFEIR